MIESLITLLQSFPTWALVITAFGVAYVENLFPPSPSDVLMVFIGSLVGMGLGDFSTFLISSTLGSIGGFCTAYLVGRRYGEAVADSPLVPFITRDMLVRVEKLFERYHGLIIIANRFLAGTRAVVAFAAGVVRLPLPRTLAYSAVSALAWNAILLLTGMAVGQRWRDVEGYLSAYGWLITGAIVIAVLIWFLRRRNKA